MSVLRFHTLGIPHGLFLLLSELAHCVCEDPRSWSFAANDMISSSFTAEHPSLLCTCHIVFMHSPVNGYYGGLQILATVNSAAMNVALQGSFSIRLCRDTDPTCGFQVLW